MNLLLLLWDDFYTMCFKMQLLYHATTGPIQFKSRNTTVVSNDIKDNEYSLT